MQTAAESQAKATGVPAIGSFIDTDRFSATLRSKVIDDEGRLLISSLEGSEQSMDLSEPVNCEGLGRVRHFRLLTTEKWPKNPLPIVPAARALQLPISDAMIAEVFQLAACNWRCWYCYVPFDRLAANPKTSRWFRPDELVDLYRGLSGRPPVLVLSGGQPDLAPEWIPGTMRALRDQGLHETTYLWSDDNLSNDYLWRYLSPDSLAVMRSYANYGRVGCFKGFDPHSFTFNTHADGSLFNRQFEIFGRLLDVGLDLYAYATFTSDCSDGIDESMSTFVDRLQRLSRTLPLRVVPLEVRSFTPLKSRVTSDAWRKADDIQWQAVVAWNREIATRFPAEDRRTSIVDIQL